MLKYISYLFIVFFLSCTSSNDGNNISSIEKKIKKFQTNSSKSSLDSSFIYLYNSNSLINKNVNISDSLKAENNYLLGLSYLKTGVLDSAAIYFHNAIDFVNDSIYFERQGSYFEKAWDTYYNLEKYGDCLTISNKFKSLLNKDKQYRSLLWAYYFEESVFVKMKDYENALKTNHLRIELAKIKDTSNVINVIVAKANMKYYYLNKTKEAISLMDSLLGIKDLNANQKNYINNELGVIYYYERKYNKSLTHYLKSLYYTKKQKNSSDLVPSLAIKYNNIAEVYIDLKKNELSRIYLDSVKFLGVNNIGKQQQKSLFKHQLRLATKTNNNIQETLGLLDSIYLYQNQLYEDKYSNELISLKKANKKENELIEINKRSEIENLKLQSRFIIISLILVLVTIIAFLFHKQRKIKFEKATLQYQQRLLRSQMNPHFMFNTLYVIQNLIKKEPEKSSNYLLKFSRLLRLILDNSLNNYVLLEKEYSILTKYIDLQLLRFPNKFTYKFIFNNFKLEDLIFIPPMILQPFIENSIEHGFKNINYQGEITITLTKQIKNLKCIIVDNGVGFNKIDSNYKKSTSLKLISNFLEKTTHSKIQLKNNTEQSLYKSGLYLEFLIPYKLSNHD